MLSRAEQGAELQKVQNGKGAGEGEQRRLSVMPGNKIMRLLTIRQEEEQMFE